ncbi:putative syntaxin [Calocera viscosa TUFC12733]|uniref:Putative syntaxin n=1 Tax=Calocera viscosa (strain TUFC12733) TaxID=1330018 RepID=A0A167LRA2_CALVF|nr:putative syntaxin [Calocera viscosa TUFC12733]
MPVQDRTNEFRACVESIRNRSAVIPSKGAEQKQRLLANGGKQREKSEFARMAAGIGNDISGTTLKLNKLAQLAKRKTLFDDRPVEISELTYIIKQDIANINKQIAQLQTYVKSQRAPAGKGNAGKQVEEHNSNVVVLLQTKLAHTSQTFADVLETRTQNMKASKDRTDQFMYTASSAASQPPPQNSLLFNQQPQEGTPSKGKARETNGDVLALDMAAAEEGQGGGDFMQMQLLEQQDNYIQSRSTAIESIESTMAELGQIFVQLSRMVAEQGETVQRIDADTTDIATNVSAAQRELLKYYTSISSNRWLMLKIFGVLIVFFLIFILVS